MSRVPNPLTSGVPSSSDNLGPVPHFGFGPLTNSCMAAKRILIRSPRRRKRDRSALHGPHRDGPPDLVRRIFLDEMEPRDRHLGLRWEAAGQVENRAVGEDSAGLGPQEQLGHIARCQPVSVGGHDRSYVGGLAIDRDLPGPNARRDRLSRLEPRYGPAGHPIRRMNPRYLLPGGGRSELETIRRTIPRADGLARTFFTFCSIGRCSHVSGLLTRFI